ncbi:NAD-dependent epimerase/dehydratase family protein [Paenibacillus validus]|uniref:NAD-dependent epimerase/dehydratase family protein n=1 Tax=Paenibacillus validus TaxID=44253 RepID=UPI003D2763BF
MKVAIAGGTGFIGRHLTQYYIQQKASVVVVARKKRKPDHPLVRYATWEELETSLLPLKAWTRSSI